MKYALFDHKKVEAAKGSKAVCPNCGAELIAKCGEHRVHHWAHKGTLNCDPWWENETEWHRLWKNNFPEDWQEIPLPDVQTNEKHIADVRTIHGLVIEFQHSKIGAIERTSRENFYKNMVWVVDGTRLKEDYHRFIRGRKYFNKTPKPDYFLMDYPELCFHLDWLNSSVPVIFDFRGTESLEDPDDPRNLLYCLFPKQNKKEPNIARISRESFIADVINGVLFKRQQEPQNQVAKQPIKHEIIRIPVSQLVYEGGVWKRRQLSELVYQRGIWTRRPPVSELIYERGMWRKRYPRL